MSTEAKRAGNARHAEKLDTINIRPYKERGEQIRQAAKQAGKSLQGWILEACAEKIERDQNKSLKD